MAEGTLCQYSVLDLKKEVVSSFCFWERSESPEQPRGKFKDTEPAILGRICLDVPIYFPSWNPAFQLFPLWR